MGGHDKDPKRLEEITAKCPTCIIKGDEGEQTMVYWGEMKYKENSIPTYRCNGCGSSRTGPCIEEVNPGISFDKPKTP